MENNNKKSPVDYVSAEELSDYLQLDARRYDTVLKEEE